MGKKTYTLDEMKRMNKAAGHHFFERGNPPVVAKRGNILMTRGYNGGYVLYQFSDHPWSKGRITYLNSYPTKSFALSEAEMANKLNSP